MFFADQNMLFIFLSDNYLKKGKCSEAIRYIDNFANKFNIKKDSAEYFVILGRIYLHIGACENMTKAKELLSKACDNGQIKGCNLLGLNIFLTR